MDMSFFTTIPGILIVCGVILLVVALVIFIVSSSKSKKPKNVEINSNSVDNSVAPVTTQKEVTPTNMGVDANNVMPEVATIADSVVAEPVVAPVIPDSTVISDNTVVPEVTPIADINNTVSVADVPVVPVVGIDSVMPNVGSIDNTIPTVDNVVPTIPNVVPEVQPVDNITPMDTISTDAIPAINNSVNANSNAELSMPEATNLDKTQVSVYGGVNPASSIGTVEEVKPVIYGGNDPLEATQKMPVIEENHIPYGGGMQMPSIEPVSVVPPVVAAPSTVESTSIPEVQPIPTVKPVEDAEEL